MGDGKLNLLLLALDLLLRLANPLNPGTAYLSQGTRQRPVERVKGFEPSSSAWKAEVLPLNYTRHTEIVVIA